MGGNNTPAPDVDTPMSEATRNVYTGAGGKLSELPPVCSRVVRIFISSTFTDTTLERNALIKNVYRKLKDYSRIRYGLEFQVVDMRWGVRDESTDDHKTTDLCMKEIERCQRLSVGPSFMLLLGQKYGYRPIPSIIQVSEYNKIRNIIQQNETEIQLFDTWYRLDFNAVPEVAVLQPISSILQNYNNKRYQTLMDEDRDRWWSIMGELQQMLRKSARVLLMTKHLSKDDVHNYFTSVTEREVKKGILMNKNNKNCSLAYIRSIEKIDRVLTLVQASNFIDMTSAKTVDTEAQGYLKTLRDDKLPQSLPKSNIEYFNVDWSGEEGIHSEFHSKYLKDFCHRVKSDIIRMIDSASIVQSNLIRDPVYGEILQSLHQCHHFCSCFQGRDEIIDQIKNYIKDEKGDNTQIFILHGASGCGKTSLLAKSFSKVFDWLSRNENAVMIIRFLGTSPDSSSVIPLLTSISKQISYNYGGNQEETPCQFSPLVTHFRQSLELATAAKPLVIFLDSLDQLSVADGGHELAWMPRTLPDHVHFVVSTLPVYYNILDTLRSFVTIDDNFMEVTPLGEDLSSTILCSWLKEENRKVSKEQWIIVQTAISKCNLPLFIKLVYDEIVKWRSYSPPDSITLAYTIHDCIHHLFDRVQITHGMVLVSRALGYLTAAKSGLTSAELEDILSLDEKVLNDVYQYHLPPERRIPALLWTRIRDDLPHYFAEREADSVTVISWYHRQFIEASEQRYFRNINFLNELHSQLADYFLGIWGGGVKKPYELSDAQKSRFPNTPTKGASDRMVPLQPLYFATEIPEKSSATERHDTPATETIGQSVTPRYNLRKLNELPYHLIRCKRFDDLFAEVLFNFRWLHSKLSCMPLQAVLADFEDYLQYETDKEVMLVADALRLSASVLVKNPNMLGPQIVGRLLPYLQPYANIRSLIGQCDSMQAGLKVNSISPAYHCLHTPGGPLQFSLEGHPFAPLGIAITSDNRYMVSVSNMTIIWDLSTGGMFKEIYADKPIQGIMMNISLSPKDNFAVSYTNNDQVVVTSIVTSSSRLVEKIVPLGRDTITGTVCGDETFVVWTKKKWYLFSTVDCCLLSVHESCVPRVRYNTLIDVGLPISTTARHGLAGQTIRRKCSYMADTGQRCLIWKVDDPLHGVENDGDLLLQCLDVDIETGIVTTEIDDFFCHSSIVISADGNTIYSCIEISENDVVCYVKTDKAEEKKRVKAAKRAAKARSKAARVRRANPTVIGDSSVNESSISTEHATSVNNDAASTVTVDTAMLKENGDPTGEATESYNAGGGGVMLKSKLTPIIEMDKSFSFTESSDDPATNSIRSATAVCNGLDAKADLPNGVDTEGEGEGTDKLSPGEKSLLQQKDSGISMTSLASAETELGLLSRQNTVVEENEDEVDATSKEEELISQPDAKTTPPLSTESTLTTTTTGEEAIAKDEGIDTISNAVTPTSSEPIVNKMEEEGGEKKQDIIPEPKEEVPESEEDSGTEEEEEDEGEESKFKYEWTYNRTLGHGNKNKLFAMSMSDDETCLVAALMFGYRLWIDVKPTRPDDEGKCPMVAREKAPINFALPPGTRNMAMKNTLGCMATLTDKNIFLVAGVRKHIYVWNTHDGSMVKTLDMHFERVLALLPVFGLQRVVSSSYDKSIKIWNLDNIHEEIHAMSRHEKPIEKLHISKFAATTTRAGVGIWDLETGRMKKILAYSMHSSIVSHVVLTVDGLKAISSESDKVILWEVAEEKVIHHDEQKDVQQILLSENTSIHKYISVSKTSFNKYRCVCRNLNNGENLYEFEYQAKKFRPLVITHDGINLIVARITKTVDQLGIYHINTGTPVDVSAPKFTKYRADYSTIVCMPNDVNQVALIDDDKASIWDIKKHSFVRTIAKWNGVCTSDGKYGLHAPNIGGFSLIDLKSGKVAMVFTVRLNEGIFSVKTLFTNDNKYAIYYHSKKRCIRVFRVSDAKQIGDYMAYANINAISVLPYLANSSTNKNGVVLGASDGTLTLLIISDPEDTQNDNEQILRLESRKFIPHVAHHAFVKQESAQAVMAMRKKRKDKFVAAVRVAKLTSQSMNRQKSRACSIQ